MLAITCWAAYTLRKKETKEKPKNYKSISQMAQNLSVCSVETRMRVMTELREDASWTDAEVDDLKGVLEGMLNRKMSINEDADKKTGLKIKYAERD